MTIQITGTLLGPTNLPSPNTTIRIISTGNVGDTLLGAPATITTSNVAAYDFNLVTGTHTVEVLYSGSYKLGGTVTIDGGTPAVLSLPELFALAV